MYCRESVKMVESKNTIVHTELIKPFSTDNEGSTLIASHRSAWSVDLYIGESSWIASCAAAHVATVLQLFASLCSVHSLLLSCWTYCRICATMAATDSSPPCAGLQQAYQLVHYLPASLFAILQCCELRV